MVSKSFLLLNLLLFFQFHFGRGRKHVNNGNKRHSCSHSFLTGNRTKKEKTKNLYRIIECDNWKVPWIASSSLRPSFYRQGK